MGGCYASGTPDQQAMAVRIDRGPWPIGAPGEPDPETSQPEPPDANAAALARVLRHREPLVARNPLQQDVFENALRCALTLLVSGDACPPPPRSASGLRYLRDRISVPRDMPLHAARRLRQALERTASLDPVDPGGEGPTLAVRNRLDQDPRPFLAGAAAHPQQVFPG
jgi:glutathione S-transferase